MAKVSVECPGCAAKLNLPDRSKLGKKIKCPKCEEVFTAEAPNEDMEEMGEEVESIKSRNWDHVKDEQEHIDLSKEEEIELLLAIELAQQFLTLEHIGRHEPEN